MAVVRSTTGTVENITSVTFNAAGDAVTATFDAGSDADRLLEVAVIWHSTGAHTMPDGAVDYNGTVMTELGATLTQNNARVRLYRLVAPSTGSNTITVNPSAGIGNASALIVALCKSGVDQATPIDGYTSASGSDLSAPLESSVTVSSATGDMVTQVHVGQATGITDGTASGFTERVDGVNTVSQTIASVAGTEPGAASVAGTVTWNGPATANWIAAGWNVNAPSGGGGSLDADAEDYQMMLPVQASW